MHQIFRKAFVAALGLTLLLSSSMVSAEADTGTKETKDALVTRAVKPETYELKGKIKELGDRMMKVEDKDGKVFTVPLGRFVQEEKYKELNLQAGTEVTLEGFEPAKFRTAPAPEAGTGVQEEQNVIIITSIPGEKAAQDKDGENAGNRTVTLKAVPAGEAAPGATEGEEVKIGAVQAEKGEWKIVPAEGVPVDGETAAGAFIVRKAEGTGVLEFNVFKIEKDGSAPEAVENGEGPGPDIKFSVSGAVEVLHMNGENLFLAESVTANGITVKPGPGTEPGVSLSVSRYKIENKDE